MAEMTIREVQTALNILGFRCEITGIEDPETKAALADFQANMQMTVSALLDDETLAAIARLRHAWEGREID